MNNHQGLALNTNFTLWRISAWGGPIFLVGFLVFWAILGKFFPPPRQYWTAAEVANFFTQDNLQMRIGMVGCCFVAPFYMVWSAMISRLIQCIEGPKGVLSNIELMGGVATTIAVLMFSIMWLTATFRIESRSPQELQLLMDIGWFIFNMTFMVTLFQMVGVGTAILIDKRTTPLFARWMGWLSYFSCFVFLSVLLYPFVMDGPFAWHGLMSYYVALTPFFIWQILFCCYQFKAINRLEQEELQA